jgi:protein SCO1/2
MTRWPLRLLPFFILLAHGFTLPAKGQVAKGSILERVGFDQKLRAQVPLDLSFRDEAARSVRLGDYLGARPVVLTLVYYRCPMLCGQELNGLVRSLKPLALDPGKDFDVVAVSINPEEKPDLAAAKKSALLEHYDRKRTERGWHFLTGDQLAISRLAETVGFRYTYNPKTKLFAHAAGLVILTPQGKVARYFYGIEFPARDLQFSMIEAASGKIGSPIARVLLLCYDYDAASGKYTLAIFRLTRILGTLTAVALGSFLLVMFRRERRKHAGSDNSDIRSHVRNLLRITT